MTSPNRSIACLVAAVLLASAASAANVRVGPNNHRRPGVRGVMRGQDLVRAHNEFFRTTFDTLQAESMAAFYARQFVARFPGLTSPITDRDALVQAYTGLFKTPATLEFTDVVISPLPGRLFVASNTYRVTEAHPTGTSQRTGTITLTWRVIAGRPKIIQDVTTSD